MHCMILFGLPLIATNSNGTSNHASTNRHLAMYSGIAPGKSVPLCGPSANLRNGPVSANSNSRDGSSVSNTAALRLYSAAPASCVSVRNRYGCGLNRTVVFARVYRT